MMRPGEDPEKIEFLGVPFIVCPHIDGDTVMLLHDPEPCPFCLEDAVKEAEQIVSGES